MKRLIVPICAAGCLLLACAPFNRPATPSQQLIHAATNTDFAWQRLARLCDTFGPRFSGTTNLEAAIDWVLAQMKNDGLDNVHGEEVMVPHWVRGAESAALLEPRARPSGWPPERRKLFGNGEKAGIEKLLLDSWASCRFGA